MALEGRRWRTTDRTVDALEDGVEKQAGDTGRRWHCLRPILGLGLWVGSQRSSRGQAMLGGAGLVFGDHLLPGLGDQGAEVAAAEIGRYRDRF